MPQLQQWLYIQWVFFPKLSSLTPSLFYSIWFILHPFGIITHLIVLFNTTRKTLERRKFQTQRCYCWFCKFSSRKNIEITFSSMLGYGILMTTSHSCRRCGWMLYVIFVPSGLLKRLLAMESCILRWIFHTIPMWLLRDLSPLCPQIDIVSCMLT